jgi:hypothetical protein
MAEMQEWQYEREDDARESRRELIRLGKEVSLIAYDPSRDVYTFDVYE